MVCSDRAASAVSVVVPVYNGERFVAGAIESIYAQTLLPTEVIVVDDGSTDTTPQILEKFAERPGFRAIRKSHGGSGSARNVGIKESHGDYVAFLDHDDVWFPQKLEHQLTHFDRSWGMSFTAYWFSTETTSELRRLDGWNPDPPAVFGALSRGNHLMGGSTSLIRRRVFDHAGHFEDLRVGQDWLMWLRIAAAGYAIGYLAEPLTEYRWHGRNASYIDTAAWYACGCSVFDRFGDRRLRAWWRLISAVYSQTELQDRRRARRLMLEAARIRPLSIRPGWVRLLFGELPAGGRPAESVDRQRDNTPATPSIRASRDWDPQLVRPAHGEVPLDEVGTTPVYADADSPGTRKIGSTAQRSR